MIDKVISAVVTVVIVLLAALFVYVSVFSDQGEITRARQTYEQEYGELFVDSLFLSYDEDAGMTYESMLAKALQDVSTQIEVGGRIVNVDEEFEESMDAILGKGNYYFHVDPLLAGISISYVLDGSTTMDAKRQAVDDALPQLIADLNALLGENASVFTQLYILDTPGDLLKCDEFSIVTQERITCEDIKGDVLYNTLMLKGFEPPSPLPYRFYNEWQFSTHATSAGHFSQSDWASGIAYASYKYHDDALQQTLTNQHVIVTVVDELSSSSKSDECFGLEDSTDAFICSLCKDECPARRSELLVNQTEGIILENDDLVIGFHSFPCDFAYDERYDNYSMSVFTCGYIDNPNACRQVKDFEDPATPPDWVNPPADVNWCDQTNCGGCVANGLGNGQYCFHSNCNEAIIDQLTRLATATGGQVQDLQDLSQLTDTVFAFIDSKINTFNLTIGVRNESRDRYVIEKPLTLSNGERIMLRFWVYE